MTASRTSRMVPSVSLGTKGIKSVCSRTSNSASASPRAQRQDDIVRHSPRRCTRILQSNTQGRDLSSVPCRIPLTDLTEGEQDGGDLTGERNVAFTRTDTGSDYGGSNSSFELGSKEVSDEHSSVSNEEVLPDVDSLHCDDNQGNGGSLEAAKRGYNLVTRTQRDAREECDLRRKRRVIARDFTAEALRGMGCCVRMQCFDKADHAYLSAQITRVLAMNQTDRRDVLSRMYDDKVNTFVFNGRRVCTWFLERAFGFSRYMQANVKQTPKSEPLKRQSKLPRLSDAEQRDSVICFLERLAETVGDTMPDKKEQHLPYFRKDQVFQSFVSDFQKLNGSKRLPSQSYFYAVWKKDCAQIKVRKTHRFTKCGDCEMLRDALERKGTDAKAAAALRLKKMEHNAMVAAERREYAKKCHKAILYPNDYCSIIVDGADQSAFGLPHFRVKVKETRGHAIAVKLIGILEHAATKVLSLYLLTEQYESGANTIIESIHRNLTRRALRVSLPSTLFVQLDNCSRENKNRFLFAYLESLVAWGVFCEVFASFLPIGHTHADIDQAFSCTSGRLRGNNAVTMDDMMMELTKSYTPEPQVSQLKGVINFSGLCRATKCLVNVTGFTAYPYFTFSARQMKALPQDRPFTTLLA